MAGGRLGFSCRQGPCMVLAMTAYPHASFRIDIGPDKRLGPGKVRLLELIAAEGSISAAARGMGGMDF